MNTLTEKSKFTTRNITSIAVMAALSIVLVYLIRIPIMPAAPFLEYDPADIPIFITTFAFGPLVGFILTVIVSVLQGLTVSASSGIIGIMMHIVATGSFVLLAGNIYKRNKTRKNAVIALISGVAIMTVVMALWNIVVTPWFMGVPTEQVLAMILPVFVPFNLIKAGINAGITFVLYKSVGKLFRVSTVATARNQQCPTEK